MNLTSFPHICITRPSRHSRYAESLKGCVSLSGDSITVQFIPKTILLYWPFYSKE
jgi:hypothetical protein